MKITPDGRRKEEFEEMGDVLCCGRYAQVVYQSQSLISPFPPSSASERPSSIARSFPTRSSARPIDPRSILVLGSLFAHQADKMGLHKSLLRSLTVQTDMPDFTQFPRADRVSCDLPDLGPASVSQVHCLLVN